MKKLHDLTSYCMNLLERVRVLLAGTRGLLLLSLLGLISGVVAGGVIILFRLVIEISQIAILPGTDPENYGVLGWQGRILLSTVGGFILGIIFHMASHPPLRVGVIHTLERLAYHEGHLPIKNAILQFIGGAISIVSGHSVGRASRAVRASGCTPVRCRARCRSPVRWVGDG